MIHAGFLTLAPSSRLPPTSAPYYAYHASELNTHDDNRCRFDGNDSTYVSNEGYGIPTPASSNPNTNPYSQSGGANKYLYFCVLSGVTMRRYRNKEDYFRGANPISIVYIASASDPKPSDDLVPLSQPAPTTADSDKVQLKSESSENSSKSSSTLPSSSSTPNSSSTSTKAKMSTPPRTLTTASTFTIITHTSTLIQCKCPASEVAGWVNAIYNGSCSLLRGMQISTLSLSVSHPTNSSNSSSLNDSGYWKTPYGQSEMGVSTEGNLFGPPKMTETRTCGYSGERIHSHLADSYRFCMCCGLSFKTPHVLHRATPMLQYGFETGVDVCRSCHAAQQVLDVVAMEREIRDGERFEREAKKEALEWIRGRIGGAKGEEKGWEVVEKGEFGKIVNDPMLKTLAARSWTVKNIINEYKNTGGTMPDGTVIERLEEFDEEDDEEDDEGSRGGRIAEDITTAIKLLRIHASKTTGSPANLRYVLEYFLLLSTTPDGLSSLSLFWPQILQSYTALFPIVGSAMGHRIRSLYEDFLLSVSSVSTKLCLELVWHVRAGINWGHDFNVGDAQMVKILVQVEAMYDGEVWGEGEGATEGKFKPTDHQQTLIWNLLKRRDGSKRDYLRDSVKKKILTNRGDLALKRKHFLGQLNLMRELGTAADECFKIQDISQRPEFLEASLERINTLIKPPNGKEGLLCESPVGEGGERILGLVEKEGRVFRSKARTPILVYLEIESLLPLPPPPSGNKKDDGMGIESFRKVGVFGEGKGEKGITKELIRELLLTEHSRRASKRPSGVKEDEGIRQLRELLHLRRGSVATSDSAVDAGQVDERLKGSGKISTSLAEAVKVYNKGQINKDELIHIAEKDEVFQTERSKARGANVEFWTSETWKDKKSRIRLASSSANLPNWDLVGLIVKANDDVRQETFVMQIIKLCGEIWKLEDVELNIKPYGIIGTGGSTGAIECVPNAMSIDALKQQRKESNKETSLLSWFSSLEQPEKKKENFVSSLAAYAIISHLLLIKDRHNGNILLDFDGNIVHIDFGFILGIAPGNQFSLETAPFKFTAEMVEVLGGKDGDLYFKFCNLFVNGFLALQPYGEKICEIVKITADSSSFPCFQNKSSTEIDAIIDGLRKRFNADADHESTVQGCLRLIRDSKESSGTLNYDRFQYYSQGYLF